MILTQGYRFSIPTENWTGISNIGNIVVSGSDEDNICSTAYTLSYKLFIMFIDLLILETDDPQFTLTFWR